MQLLKKMSEKLGAMTALKPYCWIAHTACSRDEPTPNAGPATRMLARAYRSSLSTKLRSSFHVENRPLLEAGALDPLEPVGGDDLVGVDVGALQRHPGAGDDVDGLHRADLHVVSTCRQIGGCAERALHRGGGGDGGGDEVGAAAPALAAFEVAVARARRPLAGSELVGVHRQAHRAAGLTPVGPGGDEHLVEPLGDRLRLDGVAAGYDHHAGHGHGAALHHGGGGSQVFDPAVGARTDEHGVDGDVADPGAGLETHVLEGTATVSWVVGLS